MTKSLAQFSDIAKVFETFISRGSEPLHIDFRTRGAATNWRQRAYTYRTALRKTLRGPSPYDELILRLADKSDQFPTRVTIMLRPFEGRITDEQGNEVELVSAPVLPAEGPVEIDPELLAEATLLHERLIE